MFPEFNKKGSSSESPSPSETKTNTSTWETLVLFAVNFKRLNVHMNMGNVMGNVMYVFFLCVVYNSCNLAFIFGLSMINMSCYSALGIF